MAVMSENDIFRWEVLCSLGQQLSVNTFLHKITSVVGTPEVADFFDAAYTAIASKIKGLISDRATYRGMRGYLTSPTGIQFQAEFTTNNQGAGGYVAEPLPKQICGLITRRTIYRGRDEQGRIYVPFPGETANDPTEGRPNATYLTALSALGLAITDQLNVTDGVNSCVALPGKFVKDEGAPFNFHEYTSYVPRAYWATQRRRGDYGPANGFPF